jgi:probable phosphoglycerate mutase
MTILLLRHHDFRTMTRVILILAGPTQWDDEDRLVGNHPLPLTDGARAAISGIIEHLPQRVTSVYRASKNEACDQVAKMVASQFKIRARESAALDEVDLGLWEGLTRAELTFRFPSVFPEWEESPLAVNPPDGEPLPEAIERIRGGLSGILRRNRGVTIALPLRPMAMQIALGILRRENPEAFAAHLHNSSPVETIEIADNDLYQFIA